MAEEEARLTTNEEEPAAAATKRLTLRLNPMYVCFILFAIVLQVAVTRPRHGWLRLAWQAAAALGGIAAVSQVYSVAVALWLYLCAPAIVEDRDASANYSCPLGPPNPANPRAWIDVAIGGSHVGRVVFEVKVDVVPRTAKNFLALCTGGYGTGGKSFRGSGFHRVIRGFMCQGGVIRGFESIYGPRFDDENFELDHLGEGVLSMANAGPDTNGSQFFICVRATPHLDGRHVVFAQVTSGFGVVKAIESVGSSWNPLGFPSQPVEIVGCGEFLS